MRDERVDEAQMRVMSSPMHNDLPTEEATDSPADEVVEESASKENSEAPESENACNETTEETEEELSPIEQLEIEVAKWKDQAVRTAAELDNYRKRMSREKLDAVRYGNQSLLEELLPVLDNFDMGMQAASQEEGSMLYMGMDMVRKQIGEFLNSQNVEEIPAEIGGDFDPNLHEALSQENSDEVDEGQVMRVVRKGYRIGERLLRPSNVIVSNGSGDASNDETSTETE